jgi:rhodanese-related sulfurtransferase
MSSWAWRIPWGRVPEVSPQQLNEWLKSGQPLQVVDSRTGAEYQQGTIGRAKHAPVTDLPGSLERLNLDPSRPVVVLCLSGHRSIPGTRWLRANGFEAYSLQGGVMNWRMAGFPIHKP